MRISGIEPDLSEVQRYVLDSLLNHLLTRANSLILILSCVKEVYKVQSNKGIKLMLYSQ